MNKPQRQSNRDRSYLLLEDRVRSTVMKGKNYDGYRAGRKVSSSSVTTTYDKETGDIKKFKVRSSKGGTSVNPDGTVFKEQSDGSYRPVSSSFVRTIRKKLMGKKTHVSKSPLMSEAYKKWRSKGGQHKDEKRKSHSQALGRVITGLQSRNKQTNTYSMGF